MFRVASVAGVVVIAAAVVVTGCGQKTAQAPPVKETQAADVPLPEWAPENPSPEFLRAARVLKPFPPEILSDFAQGDAGEQTALARYTRSFEAAYEFFGTMTDEQIKSFLAQELPKQIRIPVKSLSTAQRAALDHWFDAIREAMRGTQMESAGDYLVALYKHGAREDLSNVDVGFYTTGGRMVHVYFWVRQPDGSVKDFGTAFAVI